MTIQATSPKHSGLLTLGFLAVLQEQTGWLGGLPRNEWLGPTTGVPPHHRRAAESRADRGSTGHTRTEYIHADVIGKNPHRENGHRNPIYRYRWPAGTLALRGRIELPVVAVGPPPGTLSEVVAFSHSRSSTGLMLPLKFRDRPRDLITRMLERVDSAGRPGGDLRPHSRGGSRSPQDGSDESCSLNRSGSDRGSTWDALFPAAAGTAETPACPLVSRT